MANGNKYWKGFMTGFFLVPGIATVVMIVTTIAVAIAGKREIGE